MAAQAAYAVIVVSLVAVRSNAFRSKTSKEEPSEGSKPNDFRQDGFLHISVQDEGGARRGQSLGNMSAQIKASSQDVSYSADSALVADLQRRGTGFSSFLAVDSRSRLTFINDMIQQNPSAVIGLFRSKVFNKGLEEFLRRSNFVEELILRDDLLTTSLCGMRGQVNPYVHLTEGEKKLRLHLGKKWFIRIQKMKCDSDCRQSLEAESLRRKQELEAESSYRTIANDYIDMRDLLKRDGMSSLFLQELAVSPGLMHGLTPERLKGPFSKLRITARPEIFGHRASTISIFITNMRYNTGLHNFGHAAKGQPVDEEAAMITSMIDNMESGMVNAFMAKTLAGFTDALSSRSIVLDPEFPKLLNAVLDPIKLYLKIVAFKIFKVKSSSGSTQQGGLMFQTDIPKKSDMCLAAFGK